MRTAHFSGRLWGVVYIPLPGQTPPAHCMLRYTLFVNRMTYGCKNITLPQTSFAGGNKVDVIALCLNTFHFFSWTVNF